MSGPTRPRNSSEAVRRRKGKRETHVEAQLAMRIDRQSTLKRIQPVQVRRRNLRLTSLRKAQTGRSKTRRRRATPILRRLVRDEREGRHCWCRARRVGGKRRRRVENRKGVGGLRVEERAGGRGDRLARQGGELRFERVDAELHSLHDGFCVGSVSGAASALRGKGETRNGKRTFACLRRARTAKITTVAHQLHSSCGVL